MSEKNYINNKEFEKLIRDYKKNPKKYEDELMANFDLLINNIIESFKFKLDKGGEADLRKAIHYLELLIQLETKQSQLPAV
jgi:hypothetical protein